MLLFLWLARLRERWLGKFPERSRKRPRRVARPRLSRRLEVEALEDRVVPSGDPGLNGTWQQISGPPNAVAGTMLLLPNGGVMTEAADYNTNNAQDWYELQPNASGSYINGSWSQLASMSEPRLYFGSAVMPNDKVFVLGGEYPSFDNTGQLYDIASNSWLNIPNFPQSNFGDDPTVTLPNGDILAGYFNGPQTYLYNPTNNTWSNGPTKLDGDASDEETWIKLPASTALPDGGILSYSIFASISSGTNMGQVLNLATNTWQETNNSSNPPGPLSSNALGAELGGGVMLPNGKVFLVGATGNTALYDPSTNTWSAGPQVIDNSGNLCGADDAPLSILPDGQVVFAADYGPTKGTFSSPSELFDYDYTTNTIAQISNSSLPSNLANDLTSNGAFVDRTLVLPTGQMLLDVAGDLYVFTPSDSPQNAWRPAISNITNNANGTYTLTGTQLSGISEGSSYGDDVNVSENYPIVQLTDSSGNVYYATTSNWSNVLVSPVGDTTQESVNFTLPASVTSAKGAYQLTVSANGISSNSQTFYVGTPATTAGQNASATFSTNNQPVPLKAEVSSTQRVGEGTVTFTVEDSSGNPVGSSVQGSVSGGIATANFILPAHEPVGKYTIAVSYSDPTGQFFDNGDTSGTLTINPAQVSTSASSLSTYYSPNAQGVTLTANLADNSFSSDTIDEGKVTFTVKNGSNIIGTVSADVKPGTTSGGTASATFTLPAGLSPGSYTIAVSYRDSAGNFVDNGDSNGTLTISSAQVITTAAGASAVYSTTSQIVALNASLADASFPTDIVNEGAVTFTIENGSTVVGTPVSVGVIKGKASANYTLPPGQAAGNYTIVVSYSDSSTGNFTDGGDKSATFNLAPAHVAVTANNHPTVIYNSNSQKLSLSANVADTSYPSQIVNEGAVTFTVLSGSTVVGTPVAGPVSNGTASAVFTAPPGLALGSYTIAVAYSDSAGNFIDSGDTNASFSVTHANVAAAAGNASLNYSPNTQTATLNATVADLNSSSDIVNQGVVVFTVAQGSTIIGNAQGTVSGGTASAPFSWSGGRAAGNYTIAVHYSDSSGDYIDTNDTSGTLTVNPSNVTVTAIAPPSVVYSTNAQNMNLSATVADATIPSDVVNEGSVIFTIMQGGSAIRSIAGAVSNGAANASFTLPAGLAAGNYTIDVSYSDSPSNFVDSGDTSATLTVLPANVATTANALTATYSQNAQTLMLSASVADTSKPSDIVGEGTVTFTVLDGSNPPVSVQGLVANGTANAAFTLPAGQNSGRYILEVSYSDSRGNFSDSSDTSALLTVLPDNVATLAGNLSAFYSPNLQTVKLSANVDNLSFTGQAVGEGVVTFTVMQGTTSLGSVPSTVSSGTASAAFSLPAGQAIGNYTIAVHYSDSQGNYTDSGDSNATLTVSPAKVTTTASNVSTVYNTNSQTLALNANVADASIPTDTVNEGVVTFTIQSGGATLGSVQAAVSGGNANTNFTLPAGQAAGSYTLAVHYSDSSANFSDGGDTNAALTVSPAKVTTIPNIVSALYSTNTQSVKLSAGVSDASVPGDTVNEGAVTFTIQSGGATIGSVLGLVSGGTANANFTLPAGLASGSYSVAVHYSDSLGNFSDGGDSTAPLSVASANVTTTATAAAAVYSQSAQTVTLNANVADASVPSNTVNEGAVTFTISSGSTVLGSVQGTVSGGTASAKMTLPAGLAAGSYSIDVSYSDSAGNFTDSGDNNATLTVSPAKATTTADAASTTFSSTAQTVTLSAAVADPGPASNVVGEGYVTFTIASGNTVVGSVQGAVNGGTASANFTLPAGLAAGTYTLAVHYSDSQGNFLDSGDTNATLTIVPAGTSAQLTQVTLTPTLLSLTTTETLTAHVSSSTPVTRGTVTFFVSNHAIAANVDGNGNATAVVTLPMLQLLGPQDISVHYNDASNSLTASANTQTAAWRIFNPIVPSNATFTPTSESVTADLFGLFITYTNGVLAEIDYGSIHLIFSYNAAGQLAQVTFDGMNLL